MTLQGVFVTLEGVFVTRAGIFVTPEGTPVTPILTDPVATHPSASAGWVHGARKGRRSNFVASGSPVTSRLAGS